MQLAVRDTVQSKEVPSCDCEASTHVLTNFYLLQAVLIVLKQILMLVKTLLARFWPKCCSTVRVAGGVEALTLKALPDGGSLG